MKQMYKKWYEIQLRFNCMVVFPTVMKCFKNDNANVAACVPLKTFFVNLSIIDDFPTPDTPNITTLNSLMPFFFIFL